MDWKIFFTTFGTVFLAELGDKTQLATFALAGGSRSRLSVFLGSALALVLTSLIAVVSADLIGRYISPTTLNRAAGVLLIVLGGWLLYSTRTGA